jgi:hypothetical protein
MATIVARAVCAVEVSGICIFIHKHLAGRNYTRRVNDAIITTLENAAVTGKIPPKAIAEAMKDIEPDWTDRIGNFLQKHEGVYARTYASAAKHPLYPHYSRPGYTAMAAALTKHLDRDCMESEDLKGAFVTSYQLESFFAVIDDVNRASNFISVEQNRRQAMAINRTRF